MSRGNPTTGISAGPMQCQESMAPQYCRQPSGNATNPGITGGIVSVKY